MIGVDESAAVIDVTPSPRPCHADIAAYILIWAAAGSHERAAQNAPIFIGVFVGAINLGKSESGRVVEKMETNCGEWEYVSICKSRYAQQI